MHPSHSTSSTQRRLAPGSRPRQAVPALGALLLLGMAACSSTEPEPQPSHAAAGCVDDSKMCIEKRGLALKAMLADTKRAWITRPETAGAYATGVKLFAYKGKKAEMSCAELAHGHFSWWLPTFAAWSRP